MHNPNKKLALVFGVSDYPEEIKPLPQSKNDVIAIRDSLEEIGFTVYPQEEALSLNQKEMSMDNYASEFLSKIDSTTEIILFYFTGHGFTENDYDQSKLYLLPALPSVQTLLENRIHKISFDFEGSILTRLERLPNIKKKEKDKIKKVFILDCCRKKINLGEEPFTFEINSNLKSSNFKLPSNTLFSYACLDREQAIVNKNEEYSYFTKYLLKYIEEDRLEVEKLFGNIRKDLDKYNLPISPSINNAGNFFLCDKQSEFSFYEKVKIYLSLIDFGGPLHKFKKVRDNSNSLIVSSCSGKNYYDVKLMLRVLLDNLNKKHITEKLKAGLSSCKNAEKTIASMGRRLGIDNYQDKTELLQQIAKRLERKNQVILLEEPEKLFYKSGDNPKTEIELVLDFLKQLTSMNTKYSLFVFFIHPPEFFQNQEKLLEFCEACSIDKSKQYFLKKTEVAEDFMTWIKEHFGFFKDIFIQENKKHDDVFGDIEGILDEYDRDECKNFIKENELETGSYYEFIDSFLDLLKEPFKDSIWLKDVQ